SEEDLSAARSATLPRQPPQPALRLHVLDLAAPASRERVFERRPFEARTLLERRPVAGDGVRSGIRRHLATDEVEELRAHPGRGIDRRAQDLDRGRLDAQSS